MKLKANSDSGYWLLSPDFTPDEAKELVGNVGLDYASSDDEVTLDVFEMSKEEIKRAVASQ